MELICPDCRGELQLADGRTANCPMHGGVYEVLFDRDAESMAVKTAERAIDGRMCDGHPRQSAVADCASCGKALCAICSFDVGGRHYCSDCAVGAAQSPALPPPRAVLTAAFDAPDALTAPHAPPAIAPPRRRIAAGLKCKQHIDADAVAQCRGCSSGVCATCDFALPNGLHFCPACIDNAGSEEISPRRKKMAIGAVVIAVYCTLLYVLMVTGALYRSLGSPTDVQSFGCLVLLLIYAPSIVGTSIAATTFNRRLRNTMMIWTALVWNVVIIVVLGIQLIIGMVSA